MNEVAALDRRQFVVSSLAAGGMMVMGLRNAAQGAEAQPTLWDKPDPAGSSEFTPWLAIAPDDTVVVRVTTPDIGNGVVTGAASFVMEELGATATIARVGSIRRLQEAPLISAAAPQVRTA